MYRALIILLSLCSTARADMICTAKVDHIVFDLRFKKVAVWSSYKLNGKFVDYGLTRYDEKSIGIPSRIIQDQRDYCYALIQRQETTKPNIGIFNLIEFLNSEVSKKPMEVKRNAIPKDMSYSFPNVGK